MDVYVARQPIFDRYSNLSGYELLYRRSSNNYYEGTDHNAATVELLSNSFLSMSFNKLIDGTRGFINFTQDLLLNEVPRLLPKDKVVIEILENVEATEPVINVCRKLKADGYTIALDDFIFSRAGSDYTPLVELADIIKVEFPSTDPSEQQKLIKRYKNKKVFLAEKVETREEYKSAIKMGYDLFQGYFFCTPVLVKAKDISTVNTHLINILEELNRDEPDFFFISETIQKDLGLSYKVLKMANSVFFGGQKAITSLHQAIVRLGIRELQRWISMLLLKEFSNDENHELVKICLLRGRLMALMAQELHKGHLETDYFFTGIFSSIDVLLSGDIDSILDTLPISEDVKEALLGREGQLKHCLDGVLAYERFDFSDAREKMLAMGLTLERFMDLYMEALTWLKTTDG